MSSSHAGSQLDVTHTHPLRATLKYFSTAGQASPILCDPWCFCLIQMIFFLSLSLAQAAEIFLSWFPPHSQFPWNFPDIL